jgi:hypothetical protein
MVGHFIETTHRCCYDYFLLYYSKNKEVWSHLIKKHSPFLVLYKLQNKTQKNVIVKVILVAVRAIEIVPRVRIVIIEVDAVETLPAFFSSKKIAP